jgi:hypothetical protein
MLHSAEEDPKQIKSIKTGRGPLKAGWQNTTTPVMCAYTVLRVQVKVILLFRHINMTDCRFIVIAMASPKTS